jgi:hypothetical protein
VNKAIKLSRSELDLVGFCLDVLPHHGDFLNEELDALQDHINMLWDDEDMSKLKARRWVNINRSFLWDLHWLRQERGDKAVGKVLAAIGHKK